MRILLLSLFASVLVSSIDTNSFYIINSEEDRRVELGETELDFDEESKNLNQLSQTYEEMNKIYDTIGKQKFQNSDRWKKFAKHIKRLQSLINSHKWTSITEDITTLEASDDGFTEAPEPVASVYDIRVENYRIRAASNCGFYVKDDGARFMGFECGHDGDSVTLIDKYKFKCQKLSVDYSFHKFEHCQRVDGKKFSPIAAEDVEMEGYAVDDLLTNFFIPKSASRSEIPCETFEFRIRNDVYATGCRESSLVYPKAINFRGKSYRCEDGSDLDEDYFIYGLCEIVEDPIDVQALKAENVTEIPDDSIVTTTEPLPNMRKWVKMCQSYTQIPERAVIAGKDHDGSPIYVIRKKVDDEYLFGRFVESESKVGFVTNEEEEIELSDFELLTATNYRWCKFNSDQSYSSCLPICRACVQRMKVPGTLVDDGVCRIGFDSNIIEKSSRVQVLILGVTSCE